MSSPDKKHRVRKLFSSEKEPYMRKIEKLKTIYLTYRKLC